MTNKGGIIGNINFKEQIEKILHREIIIRPPWLDQERMENKSDPIDGK